MFTSSGVTTENTIKGAKYVNSKPVYFPKIDTRFDNDNRGGGAWQSLAIHDLDGTTTGVGDSYILLHDGENNSVATDDTCKIEKTWNASVCKGDVGRMNIGGAGGPGRAALRRSWRRRPARWRCRSGRSWRWHTTRARRRWSWRSCCSRSWRSCRRWRVRRRWNSPAARRPQPRWQGHPPRGQRGHAEGRHRDQGEDRTGLNSPSA